MKRCYLLILYFVTFTLFACSQGNKYLVAFENTKAFDLAKAIEREDLRAIEKIVEKDSTLLEFSNPTDGSNVLQLSIKADKYKSFEKLLEIGADPNYINPYTKYSALIESINPFGSQFEWRIDNSYLELLLQYGADPNCAVEEDFVNEKGYYIRAISPLLKASSLDLDAVKTLIKYGADPNKRIGEKGILPFGEALESSNIDIIYYFLDSIGVDVHQPLYIRSKDSLFIQDFIVNKFTKAKLMGDTVEMELLKNQNEGIEKANESLWQLIQKLESMGVDFKNYDYKLE